MAMLFGVHIEKPKEIQLRQARRERWGRLVFTVQRRLLTLSNFAERAAAECVAAWPRGGKTMASSSADAPPPIEIAVAVAYTPGSHIASESDAVCGVAVGAPVQRQLSARKPPSHEMTGPSTVAEGTVAESFLYSPQMAKVFAQFDTDSSGSLELSELTRLVNTLGLKDEDAAAALKKFDDNGDQKVQLAEWEKGLDDRLRALIEANLNEHGQVS